MTNNISNQSSISGLFLQLSNGGTSVFVSVMTLSGSDLAKSQLEIDLITWIASQDQSILGLGMVSFDLGEMPWSQSLDEFIHQKEFLNSVIERVKTLEDLSLLDYEPPFVLDYMETFQKMLNEFEFEFVSQDEVYWPLKPEKNIKCKKHGVFKHRKGCVVCNDC